MDGEGVWCRQMVSQGARSLCTLIFQINSWERQGFTVLHVPDVNWGKGGVVFWYGNAA